MNLTKTINPAQAANPRQQARQDAYHLHSVFTRISSTPSGANCDRSRRASPTGQVELRKTYSDRGVRASWTKQKCGSRFCPRCSIVRSYQDRRRLSLAVQEHARVGGTTLFLTFTARTRQSYTPSFTNAEYAFRRDREAFAEFRAIDSFLPKAGAKARLKAAAEQYGVQNNITSTAHHGWELNQRLNAFRHVLSRHVFARKEWEDAQRQYQIVGRVDAIELVPTPARNTDGSRDWNRVSHNLHFHAAIFVRGTLTEQQRKSLTDLLITRWTKGIEAKGYRATKSGQDAQWVISKDVHKVMNYITKFSDELLFGKHSHTDSLSVWDALRDADGGRFDHTGTLLPADPAARQWFRQVEQVFAGRRMLNTSVGFFKNMGVADLIAQQEEQWRKNRITETVLTVTGGTWLLIHEDNPELKYKLLNVAENTTNDEVYSVMTETGYPFSQPPILTLADIPEEETF